MLADLVSEGLATTQRETVRVGGRQIRVERYRITDAGRQVAAIVIDPDGAIQGRQTKTQLDPSEDRHYVPGSGRRLF